jgi:hypothetical protein
MKVFFKNVAHCALHEDYPVIHNTVLVCTVVNEFVITDSGCQHRCMKIVPWSMAKQKFLLT